MSKITITINTDNAAFHDEDGAYLPGPELARILYNLSTGIADVVEDEAILDINGNRVGDLTNEADPDEPMRATVNGYTVEWWGGEYAQITEPDTETPVDVLNLWDHEHDQPQQAYTAEDLAEMLTAWLTNDEEADQ